MNKTIKTIEKTKALIFLICFIFWLFPLSWKNKIYMKNQGLDFLMFDFLNYLNYFLYFH